MCVHHKAASARCMLNTDRMYVDTSMRPITLTTRCTATPAAADQTAVNSEHSTQRHGIVHTYRALIPQQLLQQLQRHIHIHITHWNTPHEDAPVILVFPKPSCHHTTRFSQPLAAQFRASNREYALKTVKLSLNLEGEWPHLFRL